MAGLADLTDPNAVLAAVAEYDELEAEAFLDRYGFREGDYFLEFNGRSYASKAIAGVAYGKQHPDRGPLRSESFSGGENTVAKRLTALGFTVRGPGSSTQAIARETELERRLEIWATIRNESNPARLSPGLLRELGAYGGAQGVWVDKERTSRIDDAPEGVAVGILHTGRHYEDDLGSDGVLYHYPNTDRPAVRDANEVEATKAARRLALPVFVVTPGETTATRRASLAWVDDWDDESAIFLISFDSGQGEPIPEPHPDEQEGEPFSLKGGTVERGSSSRVLRPNQRRFKFAVIRYYGSACAVCNVRAEGLLDAAHLCPKSEGGSDDPRNGLLLCATHHRALDRQLFAIDPTSTFVTARRSGPTLPDLGITVPDLEHLPRRPHPEALEHVWQRFGSSGV